jgi:hypothetical protein
MKPDAFHIRQIKVVSNTHWDREFGRSFEKTHRRLLTMVDTVLDIPSSRAGRWPRPCRLFLGVLDV